MKLSRSIVAPVAVLATAALTGGWFLQRGVEQEQNVYLQVRLFQEVMDHVASQYVEEIERGDLYERAIDGLIGELGDPNTSFLEASDYETLLIRTQGDYGGVGLEITQRDGFVTVVSPIPGTPGARAGIRPGDQFVEIAGEPAEGWEVDQAVEKLRGEPGSKVEVKVRRLGVDQPIPFSLERARIQLKSVPFATTVGQGIAYVPLRIVRESSSQEVRTAIDSLRTAGARGLILDLRGNPGGLLDQGIAVTDLFLERGLPIVETRGRARGQNERYNAQRPESYEGLPVVVLVDEYSASASEIIAGALQDHDRALVLGVTTYGKGSVQTLFRLSGGNALRLTTAKWYTPVGRSIHKDRSAGAAPAAEQRGTLTLDGSLAVPSDTAGRPGYESTGGRKLLGGGGIVPDVVVMPDTLTSAEQLAVRGLFRQAGALNLGMFNYAVRYIQQHPSLPADITLTQAEMDDFFRSAEPTVGANLETFRDAQRFVRYQLESEIALQARGEAGQFHARMDEDRQLMRAVELLQLADSPLSLFKVAGVPEPTGRRTASPGDGDAPPTAGGDAARSPEARAPRP